MVYFSLHGLIPHVLFSSLSLCLHFPYTAFSSFLSFNSFWSLLFLFLFISGIAFVFLIFRFLTEFQNVVLMFLKSVFRFFQILPAFPFRFSYSYFYLISLFCEFISVFGIICVIFLPFFVLSF